MINKNALKQLIVTTAITLLFTFNNGVAQESKLDSIACNNVVNMVVDALNDSSTCIALCIKPTAPFSSVLGFEGEVIDEGYYKITSDLGLKVLQVADILCCESEIDSIIFLNTTPVWREGSKNFLPVVSTWNGSEWLMFLASPFRRSNSYQASLMEKYERSAGKALLNTNNFFTLYEMGAGGLCIYCPEDVEIPPQFIYSSGLVDDFKTIIRLRENPSLLSESDGSYETYYNSMKDDLGKRVFARLFENPDQE